MTKDIDRGDIEVSSGMVTIPGIGTMQDNGKEFPLGYFTGKTANTDTKVKPLHETDKRPEPRAKASRVRAASQAR